MSVSRFFMGARFGGMRRLATSLCLSVAVLGTGVAHAQTDWPAGKVINYIVPYPAGGTTDILARLIAQKIGQSLRTTIVVENRPGATGAIGSAFVARAPADGYTLLGASTASHAINPALNPKLPYDAVKGFAPVVLVGTIPSVIVVAPNSPYKTLKDLLDAARARPGTISYASGGNGTILQMSSELLQQQENVRMTHVPYKGDVPAIQDVMAGHVDFMFAPTAPILPHVQGGKLRALAVVAPARVPTLPNVPTIAEAGVANFEAEHWQGVFAPAGTPPAIVQRLNAEINRALQEPEVKAQLAKLGIKIAGGAPERLAEIQKADIAKWSRVGKAANITLD
ncbi:Bug family tripartite tricarboxylate transporter substrate binding protein [Cupriavidus plantarum]|uniref:Bug family tripartite tricarboxylate transporter substrate binding protein n=1 Tax=Cupriavidus plantarum TaxID=942865 RepID=UPI000E3B44BB|nr:tripartite tricarboxylate transporter substrate binding protein [Cupriavidus plantarum]REF02062.1 tripartite-type tricarboxylate transporter receptor subunit TctC [Cupriavidus plantarum]